MGRVPLFLGLVVLDESTLDTRVRGCCLFVNNSPPHRSGSITLFRNAERLLPTAGSYLLHSFRRASYPHQSVMLRTMSKTAADVDGCRQDEIRVASLHFQRRTTGHGHGFVMASEVCNGWELTKTQNEVRLILEFAFEPRGVLPLEFLGFSHRLSVKSIVLDSCVFSNCCDIWRCRTQFRHRTFRMTLGELSVPTECRVTSGNR